MTHSLVGRDLEYAKRLLDFKSAEYKIINYSSKRDISADREIIVRQNILNGIICLTVCGFKTGIGQETVF